MKIKKYKVFTLFALTLLIMMGVPHVRTIPAVNVTYGSTPTVDGSISAGEYTDAHSTTFATSGGNCTVYFKHNGSSLYVAFDVPNVNASSAVQIFVDTNYDQANVSQTDDYRLTIRLDGVLFENQGTGTGWTAGSSAVGWNGARQQFASTWNAEFAIPYAKLGITAGVAKTIGISFWNAWTSTGDHRWPTGADWLTPSTWDAASSSDNWAAPSPPPEMYWKANYTDYAPSGMPDFDQRQWGAYNWTLWGTWSHCGPVAMANSLWWYDSAYETNTIPPPTTIDNFPLVGNYGPWDDHDPKNVQPLVEHLAYLMDTDGQRTGSLHLGTNVTDMETGLAQYLSWAGNGTINPQGDVNGDGIVNQTDYNIVLTANGTMPGQAAWNMAADIWPVTTGWPNKTIADNQVDNNDLNLVTANMNKTGRFYEHTVPMPDFFLIEEEVERSQDVVIIVGFYVETGPDEYWREDYPYPHGHAVTVAGINSTTMQIAISDPAVDAFEQGLASGRSPVSHVHMPPEPPYITHNNASLVSHDIYNVTFNPVMGMWEVLGYAGYPTPPWHVFIENAVITSPLVHDVAVIDVSSLYPQVDQGQVDPINVTVENQGDVSETVDVYAFYDGNLAAPKQTVSLDPSQNVTLTFNWNTTGLSLGNYTISANATIPIDDDPLDNYLSDGTQEVIPEFPQAMVLLLFMTLSLPIVVLKCKKKKQ